MTSILASLSDETCIALLRSLRPDAGPGILRVMGDDRRQDLLLRLLVRAPMPCVVNEARTSKDARAVEALVRQYDAEDDMRFVIAEARPEIGDRRAIEPIRHTIA